MPILFLHEVIIILGLFLAFLWQPHSLYYGDSCTNLLIVNAVSKYGTLDLHEVRHLCAGSAAGQFSLGARGEWYSVHEIVWPILATPFYMVFGDFGVLVFNILGMLFIARSAYLILLTFCSDFAARLAVVVVFLTPPVVTAPLNFGSDWPGVVILMAVFRVLLRQRYFLSGLIGGAVLLVRIHGVLAFPAFAVFLVMNIGRLSGLGRAMCLLFMGMLPGILAFAVQNHLLYDDLFTFSYQRRLENEYDGSSLVRHTALLTMPDLSRVYKLTFDSNLGLFSGQIYFLPVWIVGIWLMCKAKLFKYVAMILTSFFTYIGFYACYPDLVGPVRYFSFIVVLGALPLGIFLQSIIPRALAKSLMIQEKPHSVWLR